MNQQNHRRIFQYPNSKNHITENLEDFGIFQTLGMNKFPTDQINNEIAPQKQDDNMNLSINNKITSKLLNDLTKRHSRLAKNVIESQDDRNEQPSDHFLEDDEEVSDYEFYCNNDVEDEDEEDDEDDFENETDDEEELTNILKKAKEAGYLNQSNSDMNSSKNDQELNIENNKIEQKMTQKRELSTELRIDPNYKWLLKDLNLNNDKRVIDVTAMIELNESVQAESIKRSATKAENISDKENNDDDTKHKTMDMQYLDSFSEEKIQIKSPSESSNDSILNKTSEKDDQEGEESDDICSDLNNESEPEDRTDHKFINELYEQLISKQENDNLLRISEKHTTKNKQNGKNHSILNGLDDEDTTIEKTDVNLDKDDIGNRTISGTADGEYKKWSKKFRSSQENDQSISDTDADADKLTENNNNLHSTKEIQKEFTKSLKPPKKGREFSKSFEIQLEGMNNITDKIENGNKLKRNKKISQNRPDLSLSMERDEPQIFKSKSDQMHTPRTDAFIVDSNTPNKEDVIEELKKEWSNMFNKLEVDYQNKLNDQQKNNESRLKELHEEIKQSIQIQQQTYLTHNNNTNSQNQKQEISSSLFINSDSSKKTLLSENENTISSNSNNNMDHNGSKLAANLRAELKNKHSRHVQDLKEYYEKELEELRSQLKNRNIKNNENSLDNNGESCQEELKNQHLLNNELKNSNNSLLNKLYKSGQHIRFLTQENCDLSAKLSAQENELVSSNEKISNLENCCNQLELQLTETIKLQNQYIRELHVEKRNIVKKMQECEEFKMNGKFFEQKCESYELKLDERDSIITRLKTQLIQLETDLTRLEYEYKKCVNKQGNQFNGNKNQEKGQQLPIKSQIGNGLIVTTGSPTSSSSISPNSPKNRLNIQISSNNNAQNNFKNRSPSPTTLRYGSVTQSNGQTNGHNINKRLSLHNQRNSSYNNPLSPGNNINNGIRHSSSFSIPNTQNLDPYKLNQEVNRATGLNYPPLEINEQDNNRRKSNRHMSISPRRFIERENSTTKEKSPYSKKSLSNNQRTSNHFEQYNQKQAKQALNDQFSSNYFNLEPAEKRLKYIEHMEYEFDMLMKHKQQLDAQLTRLPYKSTNATMHNLRESVENELDMVDKKLSSVKLELRKLNIIKSH